MARTLTSGQEAERVKDGVTGVWFCKATWDEFGYNTQTARYASRDYSIGTGGGVENYAGLFTQRGGIDLGMMKINPRGGLAPIYGFSLRLRDEEDESQVTDTHVISNDPLILYYIFTTGGTETDADKIELMRGVVERNKTSRNVWQIRLKDDSKTELKQIPTTTLDPINYPYAYQLGAVIPEAFGDLSSAPNDHTKDRTLMAPVRFTNRFEVKGTSSLRKTSGGDVYQWYESSRRFAKINSKSESSNILTMTDPARTMYLRPSRAKSSNNISDWWKTADRDASVTTTISNGSNLDMYLSGSASLGTITALTVEVEATGSYTLTVKDDTTQLATGAQTDNASVTLNATTYSAWDLDLLNVELDGPGSGSAVIKEVYLKVVFDDQMAFSDTEPSLFQLVTGFQDVAGNYKDGSAQVSGSTAIQNPVYQLQALLRGKNLNNLATAKINTASFTTAASSRSSWKFDWFLREQVSDSFLDRFCFQAGLSLWNQNGQWYVASLDKTRAVNHFFLGGYHMPVIGSVDRPMGWEYDLEMRPPDASLIFNEVAIRYALHPATGESQKAEIASGQFRLTGTATTNSSANTLVDTSATFQTDNVLVGERIYLVGDTDYKVTSITNETTLVISAIDGSTTSDLTGQTYYLGPNIDGEAYRSQQAYKVVNALGGNRQKTFLDNGGYKSEFITDDATALLFKDHCLEWFSAPRDRIKFSLSHDGIAVELGDVLYLDHPRFKQSQKAVSLTNTAEVVDTSETVITTTQYGASFCRANDYIYMQESSDTPPEVMKVVSNNGNDEVTVVRAQLGTKAQTFSSGKSMKALRIKWIVTGIKPMTPDDTRIQIEAEETPQSYFPVGICSNETQTFQNSSESDRVLTGWASYRSGRIVDNDPDSAISYAG